MYYKNIILSVMFYLILFSKLLCGYRPTAFVVEVLTYNNQNYCVNNIKSILNQNYENFRVILINDASTDFTDGNIKRVLASHPRSRRVKYIKNKKKMGAMANHIHAIYSCKDLEVVVQVDGDDSFLHQNVLKKLDEIYQDKNVWLTYGSHVMLSSGNRGPYSSPIPDEIIKSGSIRKYKWCTSHLRTFYAGLFGKINRKYFMYKDKLVEVACDIAFMLPMVELASSHCYYVDDLLYVYNDLSNQNDHKLRRDLVIATTNYLRKLPEYKPIKQLSCARSVHKNK